MGDENIVFDSSFDLFEIDDEFLSKLDVEVSNHNGNMQIDSNELIYNFQNNTKSFQSEEEIMNNSTNARKQEFYDLPLSIGDLTELNCNFKAKEEEYDSVKISEKSSTGEKSTNELNQNAFTSCLSPILGTLSTRSDLLSSSTPIRNDLKTPKSKKFKAEEQKIQDTSHNSQEINKNSEYNYVDFDLFEDWDICQLVGKSEEDNTYITLSQALELIEGTARAEELEKGTESCKEVTSNHSIDLCTNEILEDETSAENCFADSFRLQTFEKGMNKSSLKNSSDRKSGVFNDIESVITGAKDSCEVSNFNDIESLITGAKDSCEVSNKSARKKPFAAQKLHFDDGEKTNLFQSKMVADINKNDLEFKKIEFDNDDSFFELSFFNMLEKAESNDLLLNKPSSSQENYLKKNFVKIENYAKLSLESNISVEFTDSFHFSKKKGKFIKINETKRKKDNSVKMHCEKKKIKKQKNKKKTSKAEFIDLEAEVSFDAQVSSDEVDDQKDDYDESFVDDESYFTQNASTDMTAKYLESVKVVKNRAGTFKMPNELPPITENIYSQAIPETSSEYEIDSFCVNDVEYEENDVSILEIAEQVLEIEKKKKTKKQKLNSKKKRK